MHRASIRKDRWVALVLQQLIQDLKVLIADLEGVAEMQGKVEVRAIIYQVERKFRWLMEMVSSKNIF